MDSKKIKIHGFLFYEFKFRNIITINIVINTINIAKHIYKEDCISERIAQKCKSLATGKSIVAGTLLV